MSCLQTEIEERGVEIFDLVDRHPEPLFSKAGFYQRMMDFSMRDEHFKVQMFRFVDVLGLVSEILQGALWGIRGLNDRFFHSPGTLLPMRLLTECCASAPDCKRTRPA